MVSNHRKCSCSVFDIFLGVLTGLIWFLLAALEVITDAFALIGLVGGFADFVAIFIGVVGFLAIVLFGFCLFRKIWHCCFGRRRGGGGGGDC
ncbi:ABC transporter [Rossellomorea sp. NS-SX7]|uniref:ABC transporter n=1 Tax=Rossellomorea sp. NS-SX7 TaxID=3463856 RepID=UPI0040598ABB